MLLVRSFILYGHTRTFEFIVRLEWLSSCLIVRSEFIFVLGYGAWRVTFSDYAPWSVWAFVVTILMQKDLKVLCKLVGDVASLPLSLSLTRMYTFDKCKV